MPKCAICLNKSSLPRRTISLRSHIGSVYTWCIRTLLQAGCVLIRLYIYQTKHLFWSSQLPLIIYLKPILIWATILGLHKLESFYNLFIYFIYLECLAYEMGIWQLLQFSLHDIIGSRAFSKLFFRKCTCLYRLVSAYIDYLISFID